MKKLAYLLLILPLFLFNSCTDDTPSSLTGTKWSYSLSGQDAWAMSGQEGTLPEGANISFSYTLSFTSSSAVSMIINASITYQGQTTPLNETLDGTYTYDSKTGKVIITIDGATETGTIEKNKLTIVSDGTTMVFTKK